MRNATNDLLDQIRKIKELPSDYAAARLLGIRTQTVTNYRSGRTQMSDEIALRVALVLARPPAELLALLASERAKHPDVAKVWREAARVLSRGRRGSGRG